MAIIFLIDCVGDLTVDGFGPGEIRLLIDVGVVDAVVVVV
jgi:hypothetical protein